MSGRRIGLFLLSLLLSLGNARAADGVEIYAHENVKEQFLTRSILRSVFTSRIRTWPNGNPVRVFVLADDNPLHIQFCQDFLGTYPYVLRKSWDRSKFTGTGLIPTRVNSIEEMRRQVDQTPGAIGYVVAAPEPEAWLLPSALLVRRNPQL